MNGDKHNSKHYSDWTDHHFDKYPLIKVKMSFFRNYNRNEYSPASGNYQQHP